MVKRVRIVIEVDIAKSELHFIVDDDKVHGTWRLAECKDLSADELEKQIGGSALALLSLEAGQSIGNRDYMTELQDFSWKMVRMLEQRLAEGEERAIVTIVQRLCVIATVHTDPTPLAQAEAALRDAVARGNPFAVEYMDKHWEFERQSVIDGLAARGLKTDD